MMIDTNSSRSRRKSLPRARRRRRADSGAFMIFGKDRDLFEVARNFAHFFAHEKCGFCTPCGVGTNLLRDARDKIAEGRARAMRSTN